MWALIIVILIGGGLFLLVRGVGKLSGANEPADSIADRSAVPTARGGTSPEHVPPAPRGPATEAWSTRQDQYEVAGEFFRQDSIGHVFRGRLTTSIDGVELRHPAALVPDPQNPHDGNAVAVFVEGHHVGYLERSDARRFHGAIAAFSERGALLSVRSRQWARYDPDRNQINARVTVSLPSPHALVPSNAFPDNGVLLLPGGTAQVTREDEHMEVLVPLLGTEGEDVHLAASLHPFEDIRPRTTVSLIAVRVNGLQVGVLSTTWTSNLLPLVRHVESGGGVAVVRATLRGNRLKAEVTLHVAKAQDVDPAWIAKFGAQD